MALVFTDWLNYTDESSRACTLNWSDPTGQLLRPHLEAIRLAINERLLVSPPVYWGGVQIPSYTFDQSTIAHYTDGWNYALSIIDSAVSALIPMFVNYTDNAGDWDGVGTIPNWTEQTLLTDIALGTSRLTTKIRGVRLSSWVRQQYEILRRLRWAKRDLARSPDWGSSFELRGAYEPSPGWDSASWEAAGATNHRISAHAYFDGSTRYRFRISGNFHVPAPAGVSKRDFDLYAFATAMNTESGGGINDGWEWSLQDSGIALHQDAYAKLSTHTGVAGVHDTEILNHIETALPDETDGTNRWKGFCIYTALTVNKFNVPDGFVFGDGEGSGS